MKTEEVLKTKVKEDSELYQLGVATGLNLYIRDWPPSPRTASMLTNAKTSVMADLKRAKAGKEEQKVIATAMRAIMAAVYYDGGLDAAKRLMQRFGFLIAMPELAV